MIQGPPRCTLTYTLLPYATLFRYVAQDRLQLVVAPGQHGAELCEARQGSLDVAAGPVQRLGELRGIAEERVDLGLAVPDRPADQDAAAKDAAQVGLVADDRRWDGAEIAERLGVEVAKGRDRKGTRRTCRPQSAT